MVEEGVSVERERGDFIISKHTKTQCKREFTFVSSTNNTLECSFFIFSLPYRQRAPHPNKQEKGCQRNKSVIVTYPPLLVDCALTGSPPLVLVGSMDEEEIIARLEESGAKFYVDMDFPAGEESLYRYVPNIKK